MKLAKKDMKFVFWASVASLLVMAFLHLINPILNPAEARVELRAEEVEEASRQIVSLRASDVLPLLKSPDGRPTMVMVYASWCSYCRKQMLDMRALIDDGSTRGVNPVFLSIDVEPRKLAAYLASLGFNKLFTPYVVKQSGVNSLEKNLKLAGSGFTGTIPYLGFFDANGALIAEIHGAVGFFAIRDKIKALK